MKFVKILKAIYKQYNLTAIDIAKTCHIDVKEVKDWEEEKELPCEHDLHHLSEAYALPIKLLEESIKEK